MSLETWLELKYQVSADYQPAEGATRNYPGCDESVANVVVLLNGFDVTDAVRADPNVFALFEDAALEHYRDQHARNAESMLSHHGRVAHRLIFGGAK